MSCLTSIESSRQSVEERCYCEIPDDAAQLGANVPPSELVLETLVDALHQRLVPPTSQLAAGTPSVEGCV